MCQAVVSRVLIGKAEGIDVELSRAAGCRALCRRGCKVREALACMRMMRTLERPSQLFVRGQGSWLWDVEGDAYLDFTQGLMANSWGIVRAFWWVPCGARWTI